MAKKPNAAQITRGLAQLGGGSKKSGGGGMVKGMENLFKLGGLKALESKPSRLRQIGKFLRIGSGKK